MGSFQFDCEFCESTVKGATAATIKINAQAHLHTHHETELLDSLRDTISGAECNNDCGYVFPVDGCEIADFNCPDCGYDHFSEFVQEYLFWQVERK